MSNVHLNYLCNIAANSNGKLNKINFVFFFLLLKISILDGTSPSPMLFTSINTTKNDISSRHQQIIDAFLNDGNTKKTKLKI
jgi:hypothetical protein